MSFYREREWERETHIIVIVIIMGVASNMISRLNTKVVSVSAGGRMFYPYLSIIYIFHFSPRVIFICVFTYLNVTTDQEGFSNWFQFQFFSHLLISFSIDTEKFIYMWPDEYWKVEYMRGERGLTFIDTIYVCVCVCV